MSQQETLVEHGDMASFPSDLFKKLLLQYVAMTYSPEEIREYGQRIDLSIVDDEGTGLPVTVMNCGLAELIGLPTEEEEEAK